MKRTEKDMLKKFGGNIAAARKKCGFTQEQLADKTDISVVSIAFLETGKRWPRPPTLDKVARALKTTISELLKGV